MDQIALALAAYTCGFLWAKAMVLPRWWEETVRWFVFLLVIAAFMSIGIRRG